jgi:hypothetical protein
MGENRVDGVGPMLPLTKSASAAADKPDDTQEIVDRLRAESQVTIDRLRAESQATIDHLTVENRRLAADKHLLAVKYQGVQQENEGLKEGLQEKQIELAVARRNAVQANNALVALRDPYLSYGYEDDIREEDMGDGRPIQPPARFVPDIIPPGYFSIASVMKGCLEMGIKISSETVRRDAHAGKFGEVKRSSSGALLINGDRFRSYLLATKRARYAG